MKITANKVTLVRVFLLPIPCALLFGGPWEKAVGLVLYILIGITDYLDGYLARKQGPTPLGAMIDPMADKVYVTTMFVPLAYQGVIPIWMLLVLLTREFAVTELRSIHGAKGATFRTSDLAKYKTGIQMISGGAIICMEIFKDGSWVFLPMGIFWALTVGMGLSYYRSRGSVGSRSVVFFVLASSAIILRAALPYTLAIWILMAGVLAITLASGIHYAFRTWRHLGKEAIGGFGMREWVSFMGTGLVFPVIYTCALYLKDIAVWLVIAILAVEFALGGLKNSLITLGKPSPYMPQPIKALLMDATGLAALLLIVAPLPHRQLIINGLLLAVLLGDVVDGFKLFYENRRLILASQVCTS